MPLEIIPNPSPLIVALPYTGTNMPRMFGERLTNPSLSITEPDQCLDRLLGGVTDDLNLLRADFHRFMSDVDIPPPSRDLTPQKGMFGVVPLLDSDGASIWNTPPSRKEAASWQSMYYAPYHAALAAQIARVRARYGHAVVINCRARPRRTTRHFNGEIVDIGLSTFMGASCSVGLSTRLAALVRSTASYTTAVNGHSTAGWTTRHYGRPATGTHAIDLDFNDACYLTAGDNPGLFDAAKAEPLRELISDLFGVLAKWDPT